jgi:hypothetical protein
MLSFHSSFRELWDEDRKNSRMNFERQAMSRGRFKERRSPKRRFIRFGGLAVTDCESKRPGFQTAAV